MINDTIFQLSERLEKRFQASSTILHVVRPYQHLLCSIYNQLQADELVQVKPIVKQS
jgi:hypothetical protein